MTAPIAETELRTRYQAAIADRGATARSGCPTPEAIQALIDRVGAEEQRLEVLDHVMGCANCHREFELLRAIAAAERGAENQFTATGGAGRKLLQQLDRRGWMVAAAIVVVATGGIALLRGGLLGNLGPDLTRSGHANAGGQGVSVIGAIRAGPGETRELVWHSVSGAQRYRVEVLDASGNVEFQAQTPDTVVALPSLTGNGPRTWWARAKMADGTERRSPVVDLPEP
jgi:hypothetical protein